MLLVLKLDLGPFILVKLFILPIGWFRSHDFPKIFGSFSNNILQYDLEPSIGAPIVFIFSTVPIIFIQDTQSAYSLMYIQS